MSTASALTKAVTTATRGLTVTSPAIPCIPGLDAPALVPLRLEGHEPINGLFEYRLTLQTPDELSLASVGVSGVRAQAANIDLSTFIGREISCSIELEGMGSFVAGVAAGTGGMGGLPGAGSGAREINALITDARFVGVDSRYAVYELTLRPWLHLGTLTSDCKVFQDMTPVAVIEAVLKDYPYAVNKRLLETYPLRDYCVQFNESDYAFISRLMAEWGINHHFEHSGGVHRLVLSDHNGAFSPFGADFAGSREVSGSKELNPYHTIPFYPLGHKLDREYIHAFALKHQMGSTGYETRDYDYTRPKAPLTAVAKAAGANDATKPTNSPKFEVFQWRGQATGLVTSVPGSDYSQPNAGSSKEANQTEGQGTQLANLRGEALAQHSQRVVGAGHIRGIVTGHSFTLERHPRTVANGEYIVLSTQLLVINASEDTQRDSSGGSAGKGNNSNNPNNNRFGTLSDAARQTGQWHIAVSFEAQVSKQPLRPGSQATAAMGAGHTKPDALVHLKPYIHGPESAIVCGPDEATAENNIYTDALGRIKVQFAWDRYGAKDHHSSCWLRVASPWAGNQLGAVHLPRVGQEVIVSFMGGDPDLPVVTGSVYNQLNMPPWALPSQQALTGLRSRELKPSGGNSAAGRSNHLILDDTADKIQAQLKSDHQSSSLSLGHITRIEKNPGRSDERGQGFELRTDGHGVLRAAEGLLISTEGRSNASAHITDMGETLGRLSQSHNQVQSQAELAEQHKAQEAEDQAEVAKALEAQSKGIKGQKSEGGKAELTEPHLVLASAAGIAATTLGSTHVHAGEHVALVSGNHTSLSVGGGLFASVKESIRLFAQRLELRLASSKGMIEMQALRDSVNLLAKLDITLTADTITLKAKDEIVINGGGSFTKWNKDGITHGTAGTFSVHAGSYLASSPQGVPLDLRNTPLSHDEQFELKDGAGKLFANTAYTAKMPNGKLIYGETDANGKTDRFALKEGDEVLIYLGHIEV